jgi:GT2 family glycosyltransferase
VVRRSAKGYSSRSTRDTVNRGDSSATRGAAPPPELRGATGPMTKASTRRTQTEYDQSNDGAPRENRRSDQASENIFEPISALQDDLIPATSFDEAEYLRLNPDVRRAIELGQFESGHAHYVSYGRAEGRPTASGPAEVRNVTLTAIGSEQGDVLPLQARCTVETLLIAPGRGLMVVGWIDDAVHPLTCIRIIAPAWNAVVDVSRIVRVRRVDVETAIGSRAPHPLGYFGFLHIDRGGDASGPINVELWREGVVPIALQCDVTIVGDTELRDSALTYLAGASFYGNPAIESMAYLGRGAGAELIHLNKAITRRIVAAPFVEQFGPLHKSPRGTIIVCLYGKAEFYFVQNCLFTGLPGIDEYEFIYVSNSPEMAETLLREAHSSSLIYGLANRVMVLPGNAGFGGANNAAARIARSERLLFINPDVFPRDREWARKHIDLVDAAPRSQTLLFGLPLYYDDGSLMHGGMYYEIDTGLTMSNETLSARQICRVEHYGKGAPAESPQFTRARPVPGVTGAFLSIEDAWFKSLGGFTEDFIFGHYEDADLCLKSIAKGVAPWLQDIRMWHLEGKGSTRQVAHEGGSMVNRWLFSQTWLRTIAADLKGPHPSHALFQSHISDSNIAEPNSDNRKSGRRRRQIE